MRLRGKVWEINEPVEGIYELVLARNTRNQTLYAVFTLFGDKWASEFESLNIDELIEVDFFVKAKSYIDKNGKERWSNSLIANKLIYEREPKEVQQNLHQAFNDFNNKKRGD
tara:strand:- start:184 stop:519 length:336 start_codon:yes stop_codon:yes gene_type:complete